MLKNWLSRVDIYPSFVHIEKCIWDLDKMTDKTEPSCVKWHMHSIVTALATEDGSVATEIDDFIELASFAGYTFTRGNLKKWAQSHVDAQRFIEAAESDVEMAEKIRNAKSFQALIAIAKSAGITVSRDTLYWTRVNQVAALHIEGSWWFENMRTHINDIQFADYGYGQQAFEEMVAAIKEQEGNNKNAE